MMVFSAVTLMVSRSEDAGTNTERYSTKQEETLTNERLKGPGWQVTAQTYQKLEPLTLTWLHFLSMFQ